MMDVSQSSLIRLSDYIHSLFAGLMPYYDKFDDDSIQKATKKGPPYIDPRYKKRSFIEGRMVQIMDKCHKLEPSERVSIFEVVRHLRETREMHRKSKIGGGGRWSLYSLFAIVWTRPTNHKTYAIFNKSLL